MPRLIDFWNFRKTDRDKFEILAFHDGTVKDFADLDKKMESSKKKFWGGRDLPFPILLDATGQTIKEWGIHGFPTTLLINPEGKLVGEADELLLEEKLHPRPLSVRMAEALNTRVSSFSIEDPRLETACKMLSHRMRLPISLDRESLKAAGIASDMPVPFTMTDSFSLSLRSVLNLLLEADDLIYEQDDKGLVIRHRKPDAPRAEPSKAERYHDKRIEDTLDRKKVSFDFKEKSLAEVAQFFEKIIRENFVLSPRDRKAGTLDPKMLVTGSAKDVPVREALTKLLEPLGVCYIIRNEVVELTAKPKATPRK